MKTTQQAVNDLHDAWIDMWFEISKIKWIKALLSWTTRILTMGRMK